MHETNISNNDIELLSFRIQAVSDLLADDFSGF